MAPHRQISVVLAKRGYEAWVIVAAESLDGVRGFSFKPNEAIEAETPRNAKQWMELHMNGSYRETLDQPGFSARFDLQMAFDGSRSFRKLCAEYARRMQFA